MLEIRNSLNADRGHESPQVVRLRADVTRLKAESKEQKDSIAALKRDVALYFANLDLAAANVRVYTCKHRDLRNIRHDQNETKQKKVCLVSDEFVGLWKTDMEFLEQYNSIRQGILGHHRAHECMHIGRGNSSQHVKNVFVKVDQRRGVFITYD
jgi:alpha-N-acetylglucosamine transferase